MSFKHSLENCFLQVRSVTENKTALFLPIYGFFFFLLPPSFFVVLIVKFLVVLEWHRRDCIHQAFVVYF